MTNCPWIDPSEVDALAARFPAVPRSNIELVLEACWPMKNEVEQVLLTIVAAQAGGGTPGFELAPAP
jgi:hypothetical protein